MVFEKELGLEIADIFNNIFGTAVETDKLVFQATRKEFPGDLTLVVFNLSKSAGKKPEEVGEAIGTALVASGKWASGYNVVKGFLNIEIKPELWVERFYNSLELTSSKISTGKHILVEYSSPNTNKPLHLGHMRNNLLGYAVGEILKLNGNKVTKVNIINDRGIHICKSMLAWKLFGNGETPKSSGMKGDHLVGKYYVEFDKHYKLEVEELVAGGMDKDKAEKDAPLMVQARNMLQDWEAGDAETLDLWRLMNSWVYEGFDITYKRLGVDFDKLYYESETYILGKQIVEDGLQKGVFYRRPDNSVWVDLRGEGLDEKLLLRSDGTSVYMTQDLGTAVKRHEDFGFDSMVYVVGNEQDYHFKVLFLILAKLGYDWASRLYHLSYNMVDLPSGKMKSREGTVVDADDLMDEMSVEAEKITRELGKLQNPDSPESKVLYNQIGMGALKYFLLKVDPEKRMLFDPNESIDFNGNTGPFIQYTHARIKSVLRKADTMNGYGDYSNFQKPDGCSLNDKERELVKTILAFDEIARDAAHKLSPAVIANYVYDLAKSFNQFYHDNVIVDVEQPLTSKFRLHLCHKTAAVIALALSLLGIHAPEQM
ncbi:MAG: arginine--tRNA ligase [Bacteroidota bacterium]